MKIVACLDLSTEIFRSLEENKKFYLQFDLFNWME